ncbi:acyl dehydratase [Mesorhizobium sp. B3-1-9]|uniref:MaoC family dehydratase n=1 Tax=Mesorhizobium sp. B3-1-9 TaxID=2589892 RepID=UPI00112A7084|nr:MaoC family dehydratase [Mesorhizobium sp. B3-1-9]TPI38146.1 acyl dehydratase [Mesorhizobium sp. B3-1-9]
MGTRSDIGFDGPVFDDLAIGDRFDSAPTMRLTEGLAAVHHAIVGGRLRLAFDARLSEAVTGQASPFAAPAFVWDIAIGQSTLVTQRAVANLFYRGLVFRRAPAIGDSLTTSTTVIGLRPASAKPGRPPRGLVAMRIATVDQEQRPILDFCRCAMLPARSADAVAAQGQTELPKSDFTQTQLLEAVSGWNLDAFRDATHGPHFDDLEAGSVHDLAGGDVVSSAPELARLTMNLAVIHHDRIAAGGQRLVYGGHTIGIAAAQITRVFPGLVTILAWHDCDHLGPVHEGDTLHSQVIVERCQPLPGGGGLAHLRCKVRSTDGASETSDVLDWRLVGLFA